MLSLALCLSLHLLFEVDANSTTLVSRLPICGGRRCLTRGRSRRGRLILLRTQIRIARVISSRLSRRRGRGSCAGRRIALIRIPRVIFRRLRLRHARGIDR